MTGGLIGLIGEWAMTWNIGRQSVKGEVCGELRKRTIDVCCWQEVRWTGHGARMQGMSGGRYKLWWSEKDVKRCHVLTREDGHVMRALYFEVEGQTKKGRPKRSWKKQVKKESWWCVSHGEEGTV